MGKITLVTGVAGTGKSTLEVVFRKKGYSTIDIDNGFASWQRNDTRERVEAPLNQPAMWYEIHDWYTEKEKLANYVHKFNDSTESLFVFGNTADLDSLPHLFDTIYALEYKDEATIRHRIDSRTTNSYGKDPVEFAALLSYYQPMQVRFRAMGAVPIDCTRPLEEITHIIEQSATT